MPATRKKHTPPAPVAAEAIVGVLAQAREPLSVDEICQKIWGRVGPRERNVVHQNLHRLDEKGRIRKHAMKFELVPAASAG